MQITINKSGRSIKLNKSEVGTLCRAEQLVAELANADGDDDLQELAGGLATLIKHISDKGVYQSAVVAE